MRSTRYVYVYVGFLEWGYPFIMDNPVEMEDLGVPIFQETSICILYKAEERSTMLSEPPNFATSVSLTWACD